MASNFASPQLTKRTSSSPLKNLTTLAPAPEVILQAKRDDANARLFRTLIKEAVKSAPTLRRSQFLRVLRAHGLQDVSTRIHYNDYVLFLYLP